MASPHSTRIDISETDTSETDTSDEEWMAEPEEEAEEEVHKPDGRILPLDGVTPEALEQLAADPRFDDPALLAVANHERSPRTSEFSTEQACQHIFRADGMPAGWTDIVRPLKDATTGLPTPYSKHRFRNDTTGVEQESPPDGTRSIAEVVSASDPTAVGQSNRFISHYWQIAFRDVVRAVLRKVQKERADGVEERIYVWFDVISIDQHHASDYAKGFSTTFMDAIETIGNVYLICEPWDSPQVLTRIWCLWELYCCYSRDASLSICLNEDDEALFLEVLSQGGTKELACLFSQIDSSAATATRENDRIKISGQIKREVGFKTLDGIVLELLRVWVVDVAMQTLNDMTPDARKTSGLVLDLGVLLSEQDKLIEAKPLLMEALESTRSIHGESDLKTAESMSQLGYAHYKMLEYDRALLLHQRCLEIRMAELGEEHEDTAESMRDIANVLHDLGDNTASGMEYYDEAKPLYERSLEIVRRLLDPEDRTIADYLYDLGDFLDNIEEHDQALEVHQEALDIRKQALGLQHPETADSMCAVAGVLVVKEQYNAALPLFEQSLEISQTQLGPEHDDTLSIMNNFAQFLSDSMGDHTRAMPLIEKAVEIRTRRKGPEHPKTMDNVSNLASILESMGKHKRALPLYEKVLEVTQSRLGAEHRETAECMNNLAMCLDEMGKYKRALPLSEQALKITQRECGSEHHKTATFMGNLASILESRGKHKRALPLHEKVLEMTQSRLGAEHRETAECMSHLAVCLDEMGKYKRALPLSEQALKITRRECGSEHECTAQMMHNHAGLLASMGRCDRAMELYAKALEIRETKLGEHEDTAMTLYDFGDLLWEVGRPEEALVLFQRELAIMEVLKGPDHADTVSSRENLAKLLKKVEGDATSSSWETVSSEGEDPDY